MNQKINISLKGLQIGDFSQQNLNGLRLVENETTDQKQELKYKFIKNSVFLLSKKVPIPFCTGVFNELIVVTEGISAPIRSYSYSLS